MTTRVHWSPLTSINIDTDKIDELVLALLQLTVHQDGRSKGSYRAWKGHDWDVMNRLHEKGFIGDPVGKAKSVMFTEAGFKKSRELFEQYFGIE